MMRYVTPNGTIYFDVDISDNFIKAYQNKSPMSNDDFVTDMMPHMKRNLEIARDIINDVEDQSGDRLDSFTQLMLGTISSIIFSATYAMSRQYLSTKMEEDE